MTASPPGTIGELVASHHNSEGELLTVEMVRSGPFAGRFVLCIYDDATPTVAPTLLDEGTQEWLAKVTLQRGHGTTCPSIDHLGPHDIGCPHLTAKVAT